MCPSIPARKQEVHPALLNEYLSFLREHQNISEATISLRKNYVQAFLRAVPMAATSEGIRDLTALSICEYVLKALRSLKRASRKHIVSSLRSFCRFALIKGYIASDLSRVIPIIPAPKLQGVPQALPWDDVQKLLAAPDRQTPTGRRDYAVLLLLASYGVRIGQITFLKLQDIRWREGVIQFGACKGGKALALPLETPVAEALLEYIRKDRQEAAHQNVFLTVREPKRPLGRNNHFSGNLRRYYKRAGIQSPFQSSRPIRHAFATRLLEKGASIKTIADLLGHRWIDTTFIYTKVDITRLRLLAREWPEVAP
jgi:site-specific recombinase XerD